MHFTDGQVGTLIVIAGTAVALGLYDVWTLVRRGNATTISRSLYLFAQAYPFVPFLLGGVLFHIFWPNCG